MKYSIFLVALVFQDLSSLVASKCPETDWTSFNDEKCVKIVDIVETYDAALERCRNIDGNWDDSITLLTVNSEEEQIFFNNLLFNNSDIFDNVWLGGIRINDTGDFAWLDGTSITGEVYSNWAPGKPTSDLGTDCIELRSTMALKDSGTWSNVRCGKRNLVVCQKFAALSNGEIHSALLQINREMKSLKEALQTFQTSFTDLDKRILVNSNEINQNGKDIQSLNQNLQITIAEVQRKIQSNTDRINENGRKIETVRGDVIKSDQSAVKNIRLTDPQRMMVYRGPGYIDIPSYIITGVENWNSDEHPDQVHRRRMEKLINGHWVAV